MNEDKGAVDRFWWWSGLPLLDRAAPMELSAAQRGEVPSREELLGELRWLYANVLNTGYQQGENGRVVSDSLITEGAARVQRLLTRLDSGAPETETCELLDALESLTGGSPGIVSNSEHYRSDDGVCFFCGGTARPDARDATDFVDAFLHWPDCAWVAARSLLSRAGKVGR